MPQVSFTNQQGGASKFVLKTNKRRGAAVSTRIFIKNYDAFQVSSRNTDVIGKNPAERNTEKTQTETQIETQINPNGNSDFIGELFETGATDGTQTVPQMEHEMGTIRKKCIKKEVKKEVRTHPAGGECVDAPNGGEFWKTWLAVNKRHRRDVLPVGAELAAAKRLASVVPQERWEGLLDRYLDDTDAFVRASGFTLIVFERRVSKYLNNEDQDESFDQAAVRIGRELRRNAGGGQ